MNDFRKIDLLLAFIIGEAVALLIILIAYNLAIEVPIITIVLPYINFMPFVFPVLWAIGLFVIYLLRKVIPFIYQFAKFIIVGSLNFSIDMGILNFLVFYSGISSGLAQSGFKAISFTIAVVNSYLWNKLWTFKHTTKKKVGNEFLQFIIVSSIGFLINLGADYIFVNKISSLQGMPSKSWAQFSAMVAAIIALFWNFIGYKFIVFKVKNISKL